MPKSHRRTADSITAEFQPSLALTSAQRLSQKLHGVGFHEPTPTGYVIWTADYFSSLIHCDVCMRVRVCMC